jgi:hypothetical protein
MKNIFLVTLILLNVSLLSCHAQDMEELKKKFILDEDGIYGEKISKTADPDAYTVDNKIYTINREFIFEYHIERSGKVLKMTAPRYTQPGEDFNEAWDFVAENENHPDKIEFISIKVMNGISNESQTMIRYNYNYQFDTAPYRSTSGVVENEMNVWMHPFRNKYFEILELNPFPYIQQPYQVGNKWNWCLEIGAYWGDARWKTWNGKITNLYKYEIIRKERLKTKIGDLECWVVKGTANSEIGKTELTAYFNEQNGFVKMDFVNIDNSKLGIEIVKIK